MFSGKRLRAKIKITQGMILLHQMVGNASCRRNDRFIPYLCSDPGGDILSGCLPSQFEFPVAEIPPLFLVVGLQGRLKNDSGFSQVKLKNSLSKNKFRVEIQTVLSGLQRWSIFIISWGPCSVREAPISVLLFLCPLITIAARYPEAGASPADCQERKKIHRHWLLYLEWFLNPSKKTTVMLASKQLKSTGAGSMHSPKINMT